MPILARAKTLLNAVFTTRAQSVPDWAGKAAKHYICLSQSPIRRASTERPCAEMKRSHEASDGDVASPQQRIQASEGGAAGAAASEVVDLTGEEDCEGAFAGDELARELTQALASHVVDLTAEDEDEDAEGRGRDEDEVQFVSESRPPSAKERQRQPAAPLGRRAEVGKDDGAGIDVLKVRGQQSQRRRLLKRRLLKPRIPCQ